MESWPPNNPLTQEEGLGFKSESNGTIIPRIMKNLLGLRVIITTFTGQNFSIIYINGHRWQYLRVEIE